MIEKCAKWALARADLADLAGRPPGPGPDRRLAGALGRVQSVTVRGIIIRDRRLHRRKCDRISARARPLPSGGAPPRARAAAQFGFWLARAPLTQHRRAGRQPSGGTRAPPVRAGQSRRGSGCRHFNCDNLRPARRQTVTPAARAPEWWRARPRPGRPRRSPAPGPRPTHWRAGPLPAGRRALIVFRRAPAASLRRLKLGALIFCARPRYKSTRRPAGRARLRPRGSRLLIITWDLRA